MNCNQVNKLSFAYCDNDLQPHLRQMVDEHLEKCPTCRRLIEYSIIESDALRLHNDISEMSPDFTKKVMQAVANNEVYRPSWPITRIRTWIRLATAGNLLTAGLVAVALIIFFLVPRDAFHQNLISLNQGKSVPEGSQRAQDVLSGQKESESILMAGSTYEKSDNRGEDIEQEKTRSINPETRVAMSQSNAPAYRPSQNIGSRGQMTAAGNAKLATASDIDHQFPIFQPSYLPEGYELTHIENDDQHNSILVYGNQANDVITLKIYRESDSQIMKNLSREDQKGNNVAPVIPQEETPFDDSYSVLSSEPSLVPTPPEKSANDDETSVSVQEQESKNEEGLENKVDSRTTESQSSFISWVLENEKTRYRLELTGDLPLADLAQIAALVEDVKR